MSCFSCFSSVEKKGLKKFHKVPSWQASQPAEQQQLMPIEKDDYVPQKTVPNSSAENPRKTTHQTTVTGTTTNNNKEVVNGNIAAQTFTFRELATATKNFRPECLLGEGGFGRVYKGHLHKTDQVVAVKQLDRSGLQGNKEFLVEVLMLSLLHHTNLVSLIGYCADGDQRLLVYEFMALGSLEDRLLGIYSETPVSWCNRMKIALGAAKGLEYLHEKANPPVIYRDLKSSNILLDEEYNPKLSDFGLAQLGPVGDNMHVSRVMGTYGYCAPEYARTGELTPKSDVYSYGVVLLEIITGKRAIDSNRPPEEQNLVNWAQPMFKDQKRYIELMDPVILGDYDERDLNQAVAVAAMCLQEAPAVRPCITDVVAALSFLQTESAVNPVSVGCQSLQSAVTLGRQDSAGQAKLHEASDLERQRAVAEAIQWGSSNSRNKEKILQSN